MSERQEDQPDGGKRLRACPVCSKLSTPEDHPFCSDRCAKIDLHRWLVAGYSIPVVEMDDIDESAELDDGADR